MTIYEAGQKVNHPSLAGTWTVTHDQPVPHRHINVIQGPNSAQVTADDAVKQKQDNEQHVFACTDAWRLARPCKHERDREGNGS